MAQIQDYLKTFDLQDRYDIDGDGNFDEPDGFIDHFQIVHAGGDEAAGDPIYGSDAIWSHRSYANLQAGGPGGLTGVNVGSNGGSFGLGADPANPVPNNPTGVWVGDYTIQPENGGLGVFAHEFAHDLGLPDLYDTSGNTGGAENNTAFWTLMSSGANIGDGGPDGIGDAPTDMGAWELFQLGWLNAAGRPGPVLRRRPRGREVARTGCRRTCRPPRTASRRSSPSFRTRRSRSTSATPTPAQRMYWSTQGDDLEHHDDQDASAAGRTSPPRSTTRSRPTGTTRTSRRRRMAPRGRAWRPTARRTPTPTARTTATASPAVSPGWVDLTATLPAGHHAGAVPLLDRRRGRRAGPARRQRDGRRRHIGDAESDTDGWVLDGFVRTTGAEVQTYFNAYIAENRQYDGYDTSLKTAYNFSYGLTKPDWVEHYPYQNGVLISYWNSEYTDNNVGDHPGAGLVLPIDAHPGFSHWPDNHLMRPRILSYDSTFGREPTDAITLHREVAGPNGTVVTQTGTIASQPAVPTFDDTAQYWFNSDAHGATGAHVGRYQPGWYSVDPPNTGTTITVMPGFRDNVTQIRVAPKG